MTLFDAQVALDPERNELVKDGALQVFAEGDVEFKTPLAIQDLNGLAIQNVSTSPTGMAQGFNTVEDHLVVVAKSGPHTITLRSAKGTAQEAAKEATQEAKGYRDEVRAEVAGISTKVANEVATNPAVKTTIRTEIAEQTSDLRPATLAAETDLNTVKDSTTRVLGGWTTYPNNPFPGETSTLEVVKVSPTSGTQTARNYSTGVAKHRWWGSTGFSPWQLVGTPSNAKGRTPGLEKWFAAVADRGKLGRPLRILAQGDSITEGPYALEGTIRWQTVVQGHLRRALGIPGGAVWPFIPAYPGTPNATFPVARSGQVAWTDYGLGWRSAIIGVDTGTGASGQLTFTFTGTRCALHYVKASATGKIAVRIDGGAPVVIDTNATTNPGSDLNAVWTSPALAAGPHTVTVTRDPSSATGQNPFVNGLSTFDGDETSGLRIIDAARSGIASTFATAVRLTRQAATITDLGPFDLAVIALGTNDAIPGSETDPATYKANIERIITSYRTEAGFTGAILLVNMYRGGGRAETKYGPYGDQLAAIAAADPNVGFLDLRRYLPDVPTPHTDVSGLGYFVDTLHPTEAGYRAMAGVITDYLLPA